MISHINGKLVEKNPTEVVIECGGVGYLINVSLYTYSRIPSREDLRLFTHLIVREDSHTLYGFFDKGEREIFRLLISVSGIGASTARTMLSSMSPQEIMEAIASDNVAAIQSVKGIGAKTAQRVIIDLRDKIVKLYGMEDIAAVSDNTARDEALSALEVLGYPRKQAEKVVAKILKAEPESGVEEIIKGALKSL